MAKHKKGKIYLNGFLLFLGFVLLFVTITLEPLQEISGDKEETPVYPLELKTVFMEQGAFPSTGPDGRSENLGLNASFKGTADTAVYAVLFVKREDQFIRHFTASAQFPGDGETHLRFLWDVRDMDNKVVPEGKYTLVLYYFDLSSLYQAVSSSKLDPVGVYDKLVDAMVARQGDQVIDKWQGEAIVTVTEIPLTGEGETKDKSGKGETVTVTQVVPIPLLGEPTPPEGGQGGEDDGRGGEESGESPGQEQGEQEQASNAIHSLILTFPNGGENLTAASAQTITWTYEGHSGDVKLDYSVDNGANWTEITPSTPNTGAYNWTVPVTVSENCLVRVGDVSSVLQDISDSVFSILASPSSSITLTSPNGGETLVDGSVFEITWDSSGTMGTVRLEYSTDNGASWLTITPSTMNDGHFPWTIDAPGDGVDYVNCRVRAAESDGEPSDTSDAVFTIQAAPVAAITLGLPNGGENLAGLSYFTVTWTTDNFTVQDNVMIQYSLDNGQTWITITESVPDTGSFDWLVPDVTEIAAECLLRVGKSGADAGPSDVSETVFTISPATTASITVTSPNGGETLNALSLVPITWGSTAGITGVKIEYSTDNGSNWNTITGSTPAESGSYTWTVPDTPSVNCLVRISDNGSAASDSSDQVFTLQSAPVSDIVVTLSTPNGGETFTAGSDLSVTWAGSGSITAVVIEFSADNGVSWTTINPSAPVSGTFNWAIPDESQYISTNCLIRVSGSTEDESSQYTDTSDSVFTINPSSTDPLTLTAPNGREELTVGSGFDITWSGDSAIVEVMLELSTDNGVSWQPIALSTDNDGTYRWLVPDKPSQTCRVRISESGKDGGFADMSDSMFTIQPAAAASLTVLSPNGGESLIEGSSYPITWSSAAMDAVENVRIEYSVNNSATWQEVTASTPNSGTYNWTVPAGVSNEGLVKVSRVQGGAEDSSDSVFSIIAAPTLTLDAPNGGEQLTAGDTFTILWTFQASPGTNMENLEVSLDYSTDGGTEWQPIIAATENDGSYTWPVPDTPSASCLVRVALKDWEELPGGLSDTGNNVFTISSPSSPTIKVTSPNGGNSLTVGSFHDITWFSSGAEENVKIEFSTDNGGSWNDIIASTPNNGIYEWHVSGTPSSTCLLRIGEANGTVEDTSDAVFTIQAAQSSSITVTSPNGGETLGGTPTHDVTWTYTGQIEQVIIEYSADNGVTWQEIAVTTNDSPYVWTLPDKSLENCLLRISGGDSDDMPSDTSDTTFSIAHSGAPSLTIVSPNGRESLQPDENYEIKWTSTGQIDTVIIEISVDNGSSWMTIAPGTDNDGVYQWQVPDEQDMFSQPCLLRISSGDSDTGPSDVSDHPFTIEPYSAGTTVVYGRVFEAVSEVALEDAEISAPGRTSSSDRQGYWKLTFSSGGTHKIKITKSGYTSVYRKIFLQSGKEGVVDDAYLTPLDTKVTSIGPAGGTHTNSDGSVEVVVPQGAISDTRDFRTTRLAYSKALPGDLNVTDNLEYAINFLFCAEFGPDESQFDEPVKIRVQNTWGFSAGTEIPLAYWDKEEHKWVPGTSMAIVDATGQFLEAEVTHFSTLDINSATSFGDGYPDFEFEPFPENDVCEIGSSVNVSTGALKTGFTVPGLTVRGGSTDLEFVYSSKTVTSSEFVRVKYHIHTGLVDNPGGIALKANSPLIGGYGGGGGSGGLGPLNRGISGNRGLTGSISLSFNPSPIGGASYGMGAFMIGGTNPSGRKTGTGFQPIDLAFTHYYQGEYALSSSWGGLPATSTGVASSEPSYYREERTESVFLVSREESAFGKGWWLRGLKKLHFENQQVVVIDADGSYRTFEKGVNYASTQHGAVVSEVSSNMLDRDNMLMPRVEQEAKELYPAHFYWPQVPSQGTDQYFVIDLGQEREVYEIGLDFPQYWNANNVWDYVDISTSTDNVSWSPWYTFGTPTLGVPSQPGIEFDPLDSTIKSPILIQGEERTVRYIKFNLGFPATNTAYKGSAVNRVYAVGDDTLYTNVDEEAWPKLEYDSVNKQYILEEVTGFKTFFDNSGLMIEEQDRQGRSITYQYNGEQLIKIQYPNNVFMSLVYDVNGHLSTITDSTGRETKLRTGGDGLITEVIYPDNTSRQFGYDDRGLLTMDKKGTAEKTYTWHDQYPVLTKVTLPNGGIRTIDAGVLKYLFSEATAPTGSEDPIDFPFLEDNDGFDSEVTFEDGRKKKYEIGKGWKTVSMNSKLLQKTHWANKGKNRIPVKIETQADDSNNPTNFTTIHYNHNMQVEHVVKKFTDTTWIVDGQQGIYHHPWIKSTAQGNVITTNTDYTYYDNTPNLDRLLKKITGYDTDMELSYDNNGNLFELNNLKIQKSTKYTYYPDHDLESIEYPDGKKTQFTYTNGLLKEVINNDGTKTVITRNARGEIETVTDEENRTVTLVRDIMGRVTKETSPTGRTVQYVWNSTGCSSCGSGGDVRLTKIIDSGINEWEFKYDIMGNAIEMIYPDGSKIKQGYDIIGRLTSFTNKRNQEITYQYDPDDRLRMKTTPEGDTEFTYDYKDRLTEVTAPDYHYKFQYGTPGGYAGHTIVQVHDVNNNWWTQHIYNRYGFPTHYYDSFQWHKSIHYNFSQPGGTPIALAPQMVSYFKWNSSLEYRINYYYNAGNRLYRKRHEYLRIMTEYSYDTNGILETINYKNLPGNYNFPEIDLDFTRDFSGLIDTITGYTDSVKDKELNADYNNDLEITGVQRTLPFQFDESYTYDTRGNRLTSTITGTTGQSYTYNNLNQLTSTSTHNYSYDADGNLTEETDIATGEKKKYFFNSENRMYRFEHYPNSSSPADIVASYKYDLFGRRIQKTVNGTVTNFFWEADNMAMELDGNLNPIRRYICGAGKDEAESYIEFSDLDPGDFVFESTEKGWYSFTKDQVGSIFQVYSHYNEGGVTEGVADIRDFDTFGNLVNGTSISAGNLGFQSKYYDQESGLYYFYHRYYHPINGRFINEDPIKFEGGLNFYTGFRNNPLMNLDPYGLWNAHMHPWITSEARMYQRILIPILTSDFACCWAACVDRNRFDHIIFMGNAEYSMVFMSYYKEMLPPFKPAPWYSPYTNIISSFAHLLERFGISFYHKVRDFGKFTSSFATSVTALQGFFNWGVMLRCLLKCL
jgi:RHS repeat-associated protein